MPSFDRVADVYDATRSLPPGVMKQAVDAILSFIDGGSVVDFGVGTGRFAAPLARAGANVVGLDVSTKMMRQALSKGAANLLLSDAAATPLRDLSFDHALAVHFVHLVDDWRAVLREIARVSRGGLITVIENLKEPRPRDIYMETKERMGYPTTKLRLGERDLVKLVQPESYEVAARYEEVFDPKELLAEFSAKLHSATWEVPDDVNAKIVAEMAKVLGAKRTVHRSLILARWTRKQVQRLYLTT